MSRLTPMFAIAMTIAACRSSGEVPNLNGTWGHQHVYGLESVCPERLPDGSVQNRECAIPDERPPDSFPKYRPELMAKVEDLRDRQIDTDTVLRCYPPGVPRIGPPAKIVQTATEVVFLYDDPNGSFYRIVPLDERPRRSEVSESHLGEARGHFEADTLVVETTNLGDETWLTDNGAFHSARLKVIERLRRVGDTIEYQAVAQDPEVLVEPWVTTRVLRRSPRELEEPPRCEERDLEYMVDKSQFHENPR